MNESELLDVANNVFTRLRQECPAIPDASYTVHFDPHIAPNTLGYATAWYFDTQPVIQDPTYTGHDFEIALHPNITWYNGPCQSLPSNTYDLQTTLLHEMIHGVGIISSIRADKSVMPTSYDLQLRNIYDQPVVDTSFHAAFGESLHVNDVDVYNPPTYESGSSFSHYLHSGVMDYAQHTSECTRTIDNDVKRMLQSIGYNCAPAPSKDDNSLVVILVVVAVILVGALIAAFACRKKDKGRAQRPLLA